MKYEWFDEYALGHSGAKKEFKEEWDAFRFMVGEKMFILLGTNSDGNEVITLKCEPAYSLQLRDEYEDIIPGYYMNKMHWNSIFKKGKVPDDLVKKLITISYELVFSSLSKKAQKEIQSINE